jgi:hypothetical protein
VNLYLSQCRLVRTQALPGHNMSTAFAGWRTTRPRGRESRVHRRSLDGRGSPQATSSHTIPGSARSAWRAHADAPDLPRGYCVTP